MSKVTIVNQSYPLSVDEGTIAPGESAVVELTPHIQNYIDNGQAVVIADAPQPEVKAPPAKAPTAAPSGDK